MTAHFRPWLSACLVVLSALLCGALLSGPQRASSDPLSGVTAIASGGDHTCALTATGGVKCWGENQFGELGNGTTIDSSTPVDVSGLTSGVAAISSGRFHTCALTTRGGVKCWGDNCCGQLGDGTSTGPQVCAGTIYGCSSVPVDVTGLTGGVAAISAGSLDTCALTTAGGVKCWGDNSGGPLGDGTNTGPERCTIGTGGVDTPCSTLPVDVIGLTSGVAAVSAGTGHTCAVTTVGGAECWGDNGSGDLGDGTTTQRNAPVNVTGLSSGIAALSAGAGYTCGVTTANEIKCWGNNFVGQLGNGSTTASTVPVDVSGLGGIAMAVSADEGHACALITGGGVRCWGYNFAGQLGNGTTADSSTPVDVVGLTSGIVVVSAGVDYTCAITAAGAAKCWGINLDGELGDGQICSIRNCTTPVDVIVPPPGDVNCDGRTDSTDAALILQYGAGLIQSMHCQAAADVNGNGTIDSLDAVLVLQFSAGLIQGLGSDPFARAQQIEEDPAPNLPGDYINLPQAFAVGGVQAHYAAINAPNTSSHVTHDVDYSAEGYPPAGGPHWGSAACGTDPSTAPAFCGPVPWGIYRAEWHPESLVHNMEHGGVVIWYNSAAVALRDQIEAEAKRYLRTGDLIVVAPYSNMPQDTIALTAWARREEFSAADFSTGRIDTFIAAFNCRFDPEGFCH